MLTDAGPVIDYLRQLEARGRTHVNVDDEARSILREFYMRARSGGKTEVKPSPRLAVAKQVEGVAKEMAVMEPKAGAGLVARGGTASEKIADLKGQVVNWPAVRGLKSLRSTMVFSVGNPDADLMLVGEAPGQDEERLKEPFVGKAGQKLNGILQAMGIERKSVYISNIVKFRPAMPNQTTNNRKPTREEMDACLPFIREEVRVVAPKVIIALGGTAAQGLLASDEGVGRMRGKFYDYEGIPLRVTYHPSYILHNEATSEKRKIWEDMLAVMERLGMSISDKQRGYFLKK